MPKTVITKYARAYLKTVFQRVFTVKTSMTAAFRKLRALQDEFSKKGKAITLFDKAFSFLH